MLRMTWRILLLVFIPLLISLCECKPKLNSVVSFRHIERCTNDPGLWDAHYVLRKYNRTMTIIDANMTLDRDLDDSLTLYSQVNRWGDGGWKKNYITIQRNKACSSLLFIMPELINLLILNSKNQPAKCPIPKDTYVIKNLPAQIPVPNLMRNAGRFTTHFKIIEGKSKTTLLCVDLLHEHEEL